MNQESLIRSVARDAGVTQAVVENVLDCTYNTIVNKMASKEEVKLFSGVVFEPKFIPEHEAVNPQTQKPTVVQAKIKCNVKLSDTFKDRINGVGRV